MLNSCRFLFLLFAQRVKTRLDYGLRYLAQLGLRLVDQEILEQGVPVIEINWFVRSQFLPDLLFKSLQLLVVLRAQQPVQIAGYRVDATCCRRVAF